MPATGPNGYPVGNDDEGNLVEWIPSDETENNEAVPMILRRADRVMLEEYKKLWDKVWWNRHMAHHLLGYECREAPTIGCDSARAIMDKYGRDYLEPGSQVEWGITQGKMMALAWVMGSDWEGSGDT